MKVLMFGWELPPHNSGGLGVACLGLLRAMLSQGLEVTFVLPRKIDVSFKDAKVRFADEFKVKFREFDSYMTPYDTVTSYKDKVATKRRPYASNLLDEVKRYAMAAEKIVQEEDFDIIHAH